MISKIIHQIYWDFSGNNREMPEKWLKYSNILRKNNKEYEYILWDENSCLELIKKNYSWFLDTYINYKYPIQKVDAIRPFILYHYGGIYIDMDFVCLKSINKIFKEGNGVYIGKSSHFGLTNAFMASSKKHPFWKIVMKEMIKNKNRKIYQTHHMYIMQSAGPYIITKSYYKYLAQPSHLEGKIYILPTKLFNPCSVCNKTCNIKKDVYCYTEHDASWIKLDTKIFNFFYCYFNVILLLFVMGAVLISSKAKK